MASVTIIKFAETEQESEIELGKSRIQIAVDNAIPGFDAAVGGACACGTCHVIVSSEWFAKTGSTSDEEDMMLGMTPERADTSRLACQIETSEALDGLVVQLPEFQM